MQNPIRPTLRSRPPYIVGRGRGPICNGAMHLKNWSLIYPDKRTPQLAPAYDLVSTIHYLKGEETAGLKYSRTAR
nr:HipA domain-containing protein [Klebsiella pneumoniae]